MKSKNVRCACVWRIADLCRKSVIRHTQASRSPVRFSRAVQRWTESRNRQETAAFARNERDRRFESILLQRGVTNAWFVSHRWPPALCLTCIYSRRREILIVRSPPRRQSRVLDLGSTSRAPRASHYSGGIRDNEDIAKNEESVQNSGRGGRRVKHRRRTGIRRSSSRPPATPRAYDAH